MAHQLSLREKLASGEPVVTLELSPPKGTDADVLLKQARKLAGKVDAINVPDCQLSILKMSSLAAAKLIQDEAGLETIWQLTCRDRNLIALQADILGAYALGIRSILALTGDPVQLGDQNEVAHQVYHLDSVRLLDLIRKMNAGQDATGKAFKKNGTDFTVGAALNPFRVFKRSQQLRLQQKMERGVDFFQTQPVYEAEPVARMMEAVKDAADKAGVAMPRVLTGIIPPKSADAARYMNKNVVGVSIPEAFIDLLARSDDPAAESIKFCTDLVETLKPVCHSFHFMPVGMVKRIHGLLDACFPVPQETPDQVPDRMKI